MDSESLQNLDNTADQKSNEIFLLSTIYSVSEEEAIKVASNHFLSREYEKSKRIPEEKKITKVSKIKDSLSNETLIYTLEYEGGGFCLVSGDNRFDPILAYSETNSWDGNDHYYSPSDNGCECDRKNAGCGPIALAMLLRFHHSPLMNMTFNGATAYTEPINKLH